jgi:hypothetical protein
MLSLIAAGYFIQLLNHSVIYSKHTDVILANDALRLAIDLDTSQYEEVISTLKGDLLSVESQKKDLNEKHQPDAVNKYIFHLCSFSTCFRQNIAHHQEISKMYKSAYGVRPVIRNSI